MTELTPYLDQAQRVRRAPRLNPPRPISVRLSRGVRDVLERLAWREGISLELLARQFIEVGLTREGEGVGEEGAKERAGRAETNTALMVRNLQLTAANRILREQSEDLVEYMQLLLMRGLERLQDSPRFMEREERFEQVIDLLEEVTRLLQPLPPPKTS
jgi:hypothetical protein